MGKVQNKQDPNGIDVRIEPKFEIPSGDPYTGGWGAVIGGQLVT